MKSCDLRVKFKDSIQLRQIVTLLPKRFSKSQQEVENQQAEYPKIDKQSPLY